MKYLEITEDNHKHSLDELNKHAKNGGESVVALTAPWCGHCQALKPELKKMRSKLKGGNGIVANVSDKYHSQLDMDTNVDGFPTIRHFKGGKKIRDYEGKRAAEELANFANNSLNSAVQAGGGKRKKTRRRRKRGAGGVMSKSTSSNASKQNTSGMVVGGIEIKNNSAQNDIEYITLYNIILSRLEEYVNSGLGSNDATYVISNTESIPRTLKELKRNRARSRELILDIASLISSYNLDLRDNEVLAIAFALYISLVGAEQYDDGTDIQRMLGLLAYGKEEYDGNKFRFGIKPKQPRQLSKKLKKIFIEITTTGDRGSLQSQIRRKMMGLNIPHSNKNSSTRGARKTRGGRRKKRRRTHNKKKRAKRRSKTKKRGGGLCASRQQPACEDMDAIMTHTFSPKNIRSSREADANAPLLIMKIGQCGLCFKIGEGWLRQDTTPAVAVALWLDALREHNWIPYGRNFSERNGNVYLLMARLAKEMNEAIEIVRNPK